MSDHRTVLYGVLAVFLLIVLVMMYNNRRFQAEQAKAPADEDDGLEDKYLLKFVTHEGSIVGETFAREGETLILKQAGVYKAVDRSLAHMHGDEIELKGDIDWNDAIAKGGEWHAANTRGRDALVTEHLTKSEDVRAPALESMKDEEE